MENALCRTFAVPRPSVSRSGARVATMCWRQTQHVFARNHNAARCIHWAAPLCLYSLSLPPSCPLAPALCKAHTPPRHPTCVPPPQRAQNNRSELDLPPLVVAPVAPTMATGPVDGDRVRAREHERERESTRERDPQSALSGAGSSAGVCTRETECVRDSARVCEREAARGGGGGGQGG